MSGWVSELILAGAKAHSPALVAVSVCQGIAKMQPAPALVRLWSSDREARLHLLASAGFPVGGGTYERIDGTFGVIANAQHKVARIAATGEALVVRGLRGDEEWIANPAWIARQGIRSFAGFPLIADGVMLGVLAIFDRTRLSDALVEDLRFVADFTAFRLAALRHPAPLAPLAPAAPVAPSVRAPVVTRAELRSIEKRSIEAALAQTKRKIFGADGAAALLGMKPTTLASRIKALGIE